MPRRQPSAVPAYLHPTRQWRNNPALVDLGQLQRFREIARIEREAGHAENAGYYARLAATRAFRIWPEWRIPDEAAERRHRRNLTLLPFPDGGPGDFQSLGQQEAV